MRTNKNEELQSRREFFKVAAKAALPVIGAVVLSQVPVAAHATQSSYCQAGYACTGGCSGNCKGECKYGCTSCSGGCQGSCRSSSGR